MSLIKQSMWSVLSTECAGL